MKDKIPASKYCIKIFDGTHETPKPVERGFPLVTSKNIIGGKLNLEITYNISDADYKSVQKRSAVSKWDVLFSMIGSVGEIYLEKNDIIPYAIKNIGVFSCGDEYKAKWLYYYLQTPEVRKFIANYLNGAVQKFLPLGALRSFPVKDYHENKKTLIDFLQSLDSKIEINNRINSELVAMAKTLYDYWFIQFDFPDKNGKPYKSSRGKMVWSEELKREIPEGWGVENIEKCCSIIDCLHSKKSKYIFENDRYYLLQLENIKDDGLLDLTNKYFVTKNEYEKWTTRIEVIEDDILITNAGRVAATAQVPSGVVSGIGRNITAIRPKTINPTYLFLAFRGADMKRQIKWNTDSGAFFSSLNVKGIKKLFIVRPPDGIEDKFEKIVKSLRQKRERNNSENQTLSSLRDWLLPMLMNGQVKVE